MRYLFLILFFAVTFTARSNGPVVPDRLEFGGIRLKLSEAARRDIQKDVDLLTRSPKYFNIKVQRARTYFPIIEKIFEEEGVPDEFKYLVLQESALIPDAVSSAKAVGFWQMKDFTAMELGLRVDRNVDERMNIVSSTRGAARYFKKGYSAFENWLNALQSYQMGIGGATQALGDRDRGARTMNINNRTYWYVKKFLAHMVAFRDALEGPVESPVTTYIHGAGKSLQDISRETGKDLEQVSELNKWLLRGRIPSDRVYAVILPGEYRAVQDVVAETDVPKKSFGKPEFVNNEDRYPLILNKKYKDHRYIIGVNGLPGIIASSTDNVQTLAKKGEISESRFRRYNDLSSRASVIPGQVYYYKRKKRRAATHYHTLGPDETLWEVSQKYGIRLDKLLVKNRMVDNTSARPGRVLWLRFIRPDNVPVEYSRIEKEAPGLDEDAAKIISDTYASEENKEMANPEMTGRDGNEDSVSGDAGVTDQGDERELEIEADRGAIEYPTEGLTRRIHTVVKGETYYSISTKYGIPVGALLQWNDREISDIIYIGDELTVYLERVPENQISHKVAPGETMYKIARQYNVTVDELLSWNNKMDHHLKVGEILKIYRRSEK